MITAPDSRQIRWKCRRGMLELDYLLLNFFDRYYDVLSTDQKNIFNILLASTDVELYQWLIRKEGIPGQPFESLVEQILMAGQEPYES